MDTTVAHGIRSSKEVKILSSSDLLNHDVANAIMLMVYEYVKVADDIETTPEETWLAVRDSVMQGDLAAILIAHMRDEVPIGFMYCRLGDEDPETVIIHSAYAYGITPKHIITESLALFEDWARFHKAKHGKFYTFRVPGAHRMMLNRGWQHAVTTYKKEL